jgi:hypothetical protein
MKLLLLLLLLVLRKAANAFVGTLKIEYHSKSDLACHKHRSSLKMSADGPDEGQSYLSWITRKLELAQRPPAVKIPRARLERVR